MLPGSLSIYKQKDNTERVTSHQPRLSMKKPLVKFSGQSVLNVSESGRFPVVTNPVCRLRRNGQSIFRPGSLSLVFSVVVCSGLSNFVSLQLIVAPYGRYSRARWGITVPATLTWFFQEFPSFVVPLWISLGRYDDFQNLHTHNKALIGCFLLHYFHR